jgi:hypothetical protein
MKNDRLLRGICNLAGGLVTWISLSASLHGAVYPTPTFTAGTAAVDSGSSVSVPITVSDFSSVIGAQFTLSWSAGVLQYVGTGDYNSQLSAVGLSAGSFGTPGSGTLTFVWFDTTTNQVSGTTLTAGTIIFSVQFTAIGALGSSTPVSFGDVPTAKDVMFPDLSEVTPFIANGGVNVIPEPVNWALGLFVCVFIGVATFRWISVRKASLRATLHG